MTPFCRVKWTETFVNAPSVTHHGVMMSEAVFWSGFHKWVCIVATTAGNIEMDPLDLTVTGVWIPGEPLGEVAE